MNQQYFCDRCNANKKIVFIGYSPRLKYPIEASEMIRSKLCLDCEKQLTKIIKDFLNVRASWAGQIE